MDTRSSTWYFLTPDKMRKLTHEELDDEWWFRCFVHDAIFELFELGVRIMSAITDEAAQVKANLLLIQQGIVVLDAKIVAFSQGDPADKAALDDLVSTSAALATQAGADPTATPVAPPTT